MSYGANAWASSRRLPIAGAKSPRPGRGRAKPMTRQLTPWPTELREIAPGVHAYIQAGGPGISNTSAANAGVIIGDDGVIVIDTLAAPVHTRALIEAISTVT